MSGASIKELQERTDINDFNKLTPEDAGRFLKSIHEKEIGSEDIVKIIDSSSNFLSQICSITCEVRAVMADKTIAKGHLIEAMFKGLEVQCYTLESISSQCDTTEAKLEVAAKIERISHDYYETVRELNKSNFDWLGICVGMLFMFFFGMGVEALRKAPRA